MDNQIERECPVCGGVYYADLTRLKHGRQTTCGRACSYKLRAGILNRSEEYECPVCGKRFTRSPAQVNKVQHGAVCCSSRCAYQVRQRVVSAPYNRVAIVDREAAAKKAWTTRRAHPKPYPDSARIKAATNAIERIKNGGGVSRFEREAAEIFRRLGFAIIPGLAARRPDGTFACVFDIFIPIRRIAVECHGTYWHGGRWTWDTADETQAKNLAYEERKRIIAREMSIDLRVLWEHEFKQDPVGACLSIVR